jgi:hypothetical protein
MAFPSIKVVIKRGKSILKDLKEDLRLLSQRSNIEINDNLKRTE